MKVEQQGGILLYFNGSGKKDTLDTPIIQFPVYNFAKGRAGYPKDWEELFTTGFADVPAGVMSVYNEYGISGEAKSIQVPDKVPFAKDGHIFTSSLSIPLNYLQVDEEGKLAIYLFIKGFRDVPFPPGGVRGKAYGIAAEYETYLDELDTWSHSWIEYELK